MPGITMGAFLKAFGLLPLCLAGAALAQAADEAAGPTDEPAPRSTPIEEIEVTGQRSLGTLRLEINRAEDRMFELFNELNSRKEFDVQCRSRKVTGTLIPTRECLPVYMKRAYSRNAQDFLQLGIPQKSEQQLWWESRHKHEAFNQEIRAVALQHPGFASTLLDLNAKKRRLAELEAEQRGRGLNGFLSRLLDKGDDE